MSAFMSVTSASMPEDTAFMVALGVRMDWASDYTPTRDVPINEIAEMIHQSVSMDDMIRCYLPNEHPRNHRLPCPIHHGKDPNFSYTKSGYRCFVCGASGDVITFVKELRGLSTRVDAMKQINADFNLRLPLGSAEIDAVALSRLKERAEKARELEAEQEAWEKEYSALLDEYCALDKTIMFSKSVPEVCRAKERIAYIRYLLDTIRPKPKG